MSLVMSGQVMKTRGKSLAGLWRPSFVNTEDRIYVFGGGGIVTDDIHVFHVNDMRWEAIMNVRGTPPRRRYGHTATRWKDSVVIFGGCNDSQDYCNDVHIFNLQTMTWHQPAIHGSVQPRFLHSAVVYNDALYTYGGFAKSSDCTYVLDELNVLDLNTMTWTTFRDIPPRYNHSAVLVDHKMYLYGGKDENGNTVSDLFVVNLEAAPYIPRLLLRGAKNAEMILRKSQHFSDVVCGRLLVFGRFFAKGRGKDNDEYSDSAYSLWMLDLDTLEWERQDCDAHFHTGGWNYFSVVRRNETSIGEWDGDNQPNQQQRVSINHLLFLGNTDPSRPQGYDHFRDALLINGEALGLFDIAPPRFMCEFVHMLNNSELSDFAVVPSTGKPIHVHQVILMTRWPYFRDLCESGMVGQERKQIEIPESHDVVLAFLRYLYCDRLDDDEPCSVVCDLLVVAKTYLQHRLKKMCSERLYRRHLTVESCTIILEKAILAEEVGLKMLALDFMFRHYGLVLKSNMLSRAPSIVQQGFLNAVPEQAILDIGNSHISLSAHKSISHSISTTVIPRHTSRLPASSTTAPNLSFTARDANIPRDDTLDYHTNGNTRLQRINVATSTTTMATASIMQSQ